jgi:leucyl-tRNA synthetase
MRKMRAEFEFWYPFDLRVSGEQLGRHNGIECMIFQA